MNGYLQPLMDLYEAHADGTIAAGSRKYMRDQFDFLGIRSAERQALTKGFWKEQGLPGRDLQAVVEDLWSRPERDYQYAALEFLGKMKKTLGPGDMPWLTELIVTKSWWDTVDFLSPHIMGYLFRTYPELIPLHADRWIEDENFWLQRAAILYQLKYKETTDEERLYRYVIRRSDSREFFVQKAIGWVLREYAKVRPDSVQAFVAGNELKPLSRREALKHFK
ncbi:DNA alkylation repair protein [Paenibacillus aurantius]|uniref:DNA alkylation repair protein n=1 Tax=Paenibacillus aurantius TaxID=2918900 RepID=A0AA96LE86_9BACL|nr:DNA alkylation repair protein [Paenibacillus aurantius]WNQ12172.1 DNA alkylation repair protein [Paenibacillus aurantius]